jgi:hypothetical protein
MNISLPVSFNLPTDPTGTLGIMFGHSSTEPFLQLTGGSTARLDTNCLTLDGQQVVGQQQPAIAHNDPDRLEKIHAALEAHGLIASS